MLYGSWQSVMSSFPSHSISPSAFVAHKTGGSCCWHIIEFLPLHSSIGRRGTLWGRKGRRCQSLLEPSMPLCMVPSRCWSTASNWECVVGLPKVPNTAARGLPPLLQHYFPAIAHLSVGYIWTLLEPGDDVSGKEVAETMDLLQYENSKFSFGRTPWFPFICPILQWFWSEYPLSEQTPRGMCWIGILETVHLTE